MTEDFAVRLCGIEIIKMGKELKLHRMLKRLMEQKGINARELSRQTKVPPSTLSNLMAGGKPQKLDHVLALAEYFGTSMEMILYGSDRRQPTLDEVMTEGVFSGWLKVEIKRAIPDKRKVASDDE